MRAVVVGTDLMYRKDGTLVPIEINTNVIGDDNIRVEEPDEFIELETEFIPYIAENNITEVVAERRFAWLVGEPRLRSSLPETVTLTLKDLGEILAEEDADGKLIIRVDYLDEAIVDQFCKDKVMFLDAMKNLPIGTGYIYKDTEGVHEVGTLDLIDNDYMPNIIEKCTLPHYDRELYPKPLKYTQDLLNTFKSSDEFKEGHHLVPYYFNEEKGVSEEGCIKLFRNWSLFVAEGSTLKTVYLATYTKVGKPFDKETVRSSWDENGETTLPNNGHDELLIGQWGVGTITDALLEKGDQVWLAGGAWKNVEDLDGTETLRTLKIPQSGSVDTESSEADYNVPFEEWEKETSYVDTSASGSNYTLKECAGYIDLSIITFTDGSEFYDTAASAYPVLDPVDDTVMFKKLENCVAGDRVILLKVKESTKNPIYELKTIATISFKRKLTIGYKLHLTDEDTSHIFLSRVAGDSSAYISAEHNGSSGKCYWFCSNSTTSSSYTYCTAKSASDEHCVQDGGCSTTYCLLCTNTKNGCRGE